ncbi:MAG: hypothetical protein AAGE96_16695 [Cyanobacteria bacterium P01_G01_bin.19]
MPQIKISLDEEHIDFVSQYREHGFNSKSAIVEAAIAQFKNSMEEQRLLESAELYQEVYEKDSDLQELTDDAAGLCLD